MIVAHDWLNPLAGGMLNVTPTEPALVPLFSKIPCA